MKMKSQAGFSLAETLVAILILLLVSVIVANGVPVAQNAYEKVVVGANAKVLLSTTISALRDQLATARDVSVSTSNEVTYFDADNGATSKIYRDTNTLKQIMIQEYIDLSPVPDAAGKYSVLQTVPSRALVAMVKTNAGSLYATYDSVVMGSSTSSTTEQDTITFNKLAVYKGTDTTNALASVDEFTIRFIKPIPVS